MPGCQYLGKLVHSPDWDGLGGAAALSGTQLAVPKDEIDFELAIIDGVLQDIPHDYGGIFGLGDEIFHVFWTIGEINHMRSVGIGRVVLGIEVDRDSGTLKPGEGSEVGQVEAIVIKPEDEAVVSRRRIGGLSRRLCRCEWFG